MVTGQTFGRWRRTAGASVVHDDSDEHVSLVTRTLGIDAPTWAAILDHYAASLGADTSVAARLRTLGGAFRLSAPFAMSLPETALGSCSCCGAAAVTAVVARRTDADRSLIYGRCNACGHGQLLAGETPSPYASPSYYHQRAGDGSGYEAYAAERDYREQKGERLVARLLLEQPKPGSLLEVGSGYGYTLQAAKRRGLRVAGVDVNPEAARAAQQLYGLPTHVSTLAEALHSGALSGQSWDVVLYQFVLEHVADPIGELRQAATALSAQGRLVLVVPSMQTFELEVFGASYRSLRGDHLHLFSKASLEHALAAAGLELLELESHCNLNLLGGFLSAAELAELYRAGSGPDLTAVARKKTS